MSAYYNEIDPYAAQWLRNLISAGHIAPGDVDERDIRLVQPDDLRGYKQCHFFAGIGVWSYALRLAGWPDDREVWTGSCPCQPFSAAGQRKGADDERHLAPYWLRLIGQRRPSAVIGEQVDAAIGIGWLDALFLQLESLNYACGAVSFPACSVGAPHIRQRLYFVADNDHERRLFGARHGESKARMGEQSRHDAAGCGSDGELADASSTRAGRDAGAALGAEVCSDSSRRADGGGGDASFVDCADGEPVGDASGEGLAQQRGKRRTSSSKARADKGEAAIGAGSPVSFWSDAIWLPCIDGKARPTKPGLFPLVDGSTNRVGKLRAAGNAIVAQAAAEFIRSYMETA